MLLLLIAVRKIFLAKMPSIARQATVKNGNS